ncbi:hypothetical protein Ppa06_61880 [Planomonospora parontospora subsp. parontospora]|uniref:Uncharacterized protein n=2 Tax=Planomonospora parontospora TaxID=58119 RepID=A0AA37BN24_9ACTN|nr:SMI1/KNR4 family protein [Planomonospora parontospora]GGK93726.1 hypothetical protein GCM10010126_61350 [Planomonospora parontospora]GII12390.1 hypothetical protein Ppa06_61880 [Planomonospora parontospora subsp. parontospora]
MDELSTTGVPALGAVAQNLLAGHRFADGEGFPASYREYVSRAGFSRLFGLWLVYPPASDGFADGWQRRAARLTESFRQTYAEARAEEFDWKIEPDGDWSMIDGLVVFAFSENGDALLWDTLCRTAGEFDVYCSLRLDSLHRLGASLGEALPRLRELSRPFADRAAADIECLTPARL